MIFVPVAESMRTAVQLLPLQLSIEQLLGNCDLDAIKVDGIII